MLGSETQTDIKIEETKEDVDLLSFGSWMRVKLSDEKKQTIVDNVYKEILAIYNDRKDEEENIKSYRNQYYGVVQEKDTPYADCFHKDVEVLTENGWKLVKDVEVGEKVISREPITGKLEFKPIIAKQNRKAEKLIRFKHRSFDIMVTENHNMYVENPDNKTWNFIQAKDLKPCGHWKIPSISKGWESERAVNFFDYNADDFLEFLGWFISEGYVYKSGTVCIAQSRVSNIDKYNSIKKCLDRMSVCYREKETMFLISLPQGVVNHLRCLGKSQEKYIPDIYLDLPKEQLRILFDALVAGDGCVTERENREDKVSYYTISKELADDIQEIILKLGHSSSVSVRDNIGKKGVKKNGKFIITKHIGYQINLRYTEFFDLKRIEKEYINYNDSVYCLTVEPWHTIYVRMNGKSLWTSQCFNLNVPLTLKITDAATAQTEEAFEEIDPKWQVGPSVRPELDAIRDKQEKVLDHFEDIEMHDSEAWGKAYHDAFLLGTGWLGMPFKREFEKVKEYRIYTDIDKFMKDFPKDYEKYPKLLEKLTAGETVKLIIKKNQEICRSPVPEKYEWEDIFVPLKTKGLAGINKAKIVARRVWKTWAQINEQEENGDFESGVSEQIKLKLVEGKAETDPEYVTKEYETFEAIYMADIDGDGQPERLLVNIILPQGSLNENEPSSRVVAARIIYYPYFHNRSYIIPVYIRTDKSGIYQDGFGAMLQDIHIAANATLNHVLDASVIANSLSLKAREGSTGASRVYEHKWYPGSVLELANMDDVQQFMFNTPNLSSLITLFSIIERFGGDATGVVNYILGQESGEDPRAPFRKQASLTRKAELKLRKYVKNIRRSINEAGYQALRLIYQFVPAETLTDITGETVDDSKDFLSPAMRTVTQSSAFDLDTATAKQDSLQFLQMLTQMEPLFMNNPVARMKAWRILARNWGSNWGKWCENLLPTPEAMQKQLDDAAKQEQYDRAQVGIGAAKGVLEQGGGDEDARAAGDAAMKQYDTLKQQQAQEAAAGAKKSGATQ